MLNNQGARQHGATSIKKLLLAVGVCFCLVSPAKATFTVTEEKLAFKGH